MKIVVKFLSAVVLLILITSCGTSSGISKEQQKLADSHYQMGLSYFTEKNITKALQELIKAYEINPKSEDINHLLGIAYLNKKEYMKAEKHIKEAIEIKNGNFPKARNNLGVVYLEQDRYDEAIAEFERAANNILYDTPEFAYTNLGWAYYKKGEIMKAKKHYEKAIEIEPRYSLSYFNLALLYFDLEKYDDSIKEYKNAVKFFPNYLDAWYNLGLTYFKIKDNKKAKEAFEEVMKIAPDSDKAELSKGYLDLLN